MWPCLDIHHAAAILCRLCQAEVYEELVKRSGWTPEAYQNWLAAALKRELLAEKDFSEPKPTLDLGSTPG